jgi:hypothetical protein
VASGRNRQKLGYAFNDAEKDGLKQEDRCHESDSAAGFGAAEPNTR